MSTPESVAKQRNEMRARFAENDRYCTKCQCKRPRKGGRAIPLDGGMRERWVCGRHGGSDGLPLAAR